MEASEVPPRLLDFLYILARDHLPTGTMESIMWDNVDTEASSYCNSFIEGYARDLALRLLDNERSITDWKHMHLSADGRERYYIGGGGERTDAPRVFVNDRAKGGAKVRETYGQEGE